MKGLFDFFTDFYAWLNSLDGVVAAVVGGLLLSGLAGLWKFVLYPAFKWIFIKVGKLIYPVVSGAIVLDRYVALPRYLRKIQGTVGLLRNPWLIEGQELKDIFIPLSATSKAYGSERTERTELKQVFETTQCAIFIGDPGSGKTTALKSIAMDCINQRFSTKDLIPVFIELRQLMTSDISLDDYVIKTFQNNGFPRPHRLIKNLRSSGKLVFLLDALDEVDNPKNRRTVLEKIRKLISGEKNSENPCKIFVTSRPTGYQGQLSGLVKNTLYMADFTPAQISKFVNNWDFRPPKSQEHLLSVILDQRPILEICRNPLMLTIVTSLYRETDYQLPDSREEFYKVCIDALLRRWDAVKELESRNKFRPGLKEAFLQNLAFEVLADWTKTFTVTWAREKVEDFLQERKDENIEPENFLEEIIRSGLLGRLDTGEIFFAHKTFAEALAASFIRNKPEIIIDEWSKNPNAWIEVCSLYVADPRTSIEDIDELLGNAEVREDWIGYLTIVGDAHTVSDKRLSWVGKTLLAKREIWPQLNRRAITALSRMKGDAQPILTAMVEKGTVPVRQEAMYSLGYSDEAWAVDLIVKSLTDRNLQSTAIESMAALADRAIPILKNLINTHKNNSQVLISCIKVAEDIGSLMAIEAILPLIWSDVFNVSYETTRVVLVSLNNQTMRQTMESGNIQLVRQPLDDSELEQLIKWAGERLVTKSEVVKTYYSKMILTNAKYFDFYMSKNHIPIKAIEALENYPSDFLIPILIQANLSMGEFEEYYYENQVTQKPIGAVSRELDNNKSYKILRVIQSRSNEQNKNLWARAKGKHRKDIKVGDVGTRVFGIVALLTMIIPLISAIIMGLLNPLWLFSLLPIVALAIFFTISESDLENLMIYPAAFGLVPRWVREDFIPFDFSDENNREVFLLMVVPYLLLLGSAIYASTIMIGYWWLCFILPAIQIFFPGFEVVEEIVFWRRSNPLLTLLFEIKRESNNGETSYEV